MDWVTSLLQGLSGDNPLVILAVVVLAFIVLVYRLGLRVLTTIERIALAKVGGRR